MSYLNDKHSKSSRMFLRLVVLLFMVMGLGTAGYMVIERWSFLESFFMTLITITTVGFSEVHPLSLKGKIFTSLLIFIGVGFFLYVAGYLVQFVVEGRIREIMGRRKLDKKIKRLKHHYIVCGYGRIGRVLVNNLKNHPIDIVVIDNNPDLVTTMEEDGVLYIFGNATDEQVLQEAGIERAKALVAVLATDTENVFLTLTARQLSPDLYIMARASQEAVKKKLLAAGADKVESPYDIGAVSMAMRVMRPTVTSFLDLVLTRKNKNIEMEEIPVAAASVICGQTLMESQIRQKFNIIIIAIKKPDETMIFNPSSEEVIRDGDTMIVVGDTDNLSAFSRTLMTDPLGAPG